MRLQVHYAQGHRRVVKNADTRIGKLAGIGRRVELRKTKQFSCLAGSLISRAGRYPCEGVPVIRWGRNKPIAFEIRATGNVEIGWPRKGRKFADRIENLGAAECQQIGLCRISESGQFHLEYFLRPLVATEKCVDVAACKPGK